MAGSLKRRVRRGGSLSGRTAVCGCSHSTRTHRANFCLSERGSAPCRTQRTTGRTAHWQTSNGPHRSNGVARGGVRPLARRNAHSDKAHGEDRGVARGFWGRDGERESQSLEGERGAPCRTPPGRTSKRAEYKRAHQHKGRPVAPPRFATSRVSRSLPRDVSQMSNPSASTKNASHLRTASHAQANPNEHLRYSVVVSR